MKIIGTVALIALLLALLLSGYQVMNAYNEGRKAADQVIAKAKNGSLEKAILFLHGDDPAVCKVAEIMKGFGASSEKGDYFIDVEIAVGYPWLNGKLITFKRDGKIIGAVECRRRDFDLLEYKIACWAIKYKKESRPLVRSMVRS